MEYLRFVFLTFYFIMLSSIPKLRPRTIDELPIVTRHNSSNAKHHRLKMRLIPTAP